MENVSLPDRFLHLPHLVADILPRPAVQRWDISSLRLKCDPVIKKPRIINLLRPFSIRRYQNRHILPRFFLTLVKIPVGNICLLYTSHLVFCVQLKPDASGRGRPVYGTAPFGCHGNRRQSHGGLLDLYGLCPGGPGPFVCPPLDPVCFPVSGYCLLYTSYPAGLSSTAT